MSIKEAVGFVSTWHAAINRDDDTSTQFGNHMAAAIEDERTVEEPDKVPFDIVDRGKRISHDSVSLSNG